MIEHGAGPDDPALAAAVAEYCQPLLQSGVDTVVLGCTHYPLIAELFTRILGPEVTLIDCAGEAAKAAAEAMKRTTSAGGGERPCRHGIPFYRSAAAGRPTDGPPHAGGGFYPRLLPLEKLTAFSTE